MKFNGFMIDCCRVLERREYYYRLIDFMSDWNMTHLQLHFTDNHGCAIDIPGFSHLAMPHAFSSDEIEELCAYASKKDIDIIPELETFGHTQYLTDHPKHSHLFAGYHKELGGQKGGGVNPLMPESAQTMKRLMDEIIKMFSSVFLHIGCDEVNMSDFLKENNLEEEKVWAEYVNGLINYVRKCGKTPIIWADQLKKKPETAEKLRKDVVVMEWDYESDCSDSAIAALVECGFENIIASPSVIFCRYRFFPTETAFENTDRMTRYAVERNISGVMNTAWCPYRYLSNSLYYAIAYSAYLVDNYCKINIREFRGEFANYMFGVDCDYPLERFLTLWPKLNIGGELAKKLLGEIPEFTKEDEAQLEIINNLGPEVLKYAGMFNPKINQDVWHAMVLSARIAWICSESYFAGKEGSDRSSTFKNELESIIADAESEWDNTRYPDDIRKSTPHFKEPASSYLIPLLRKLKK